MSYIVHKAVELANVSNKVLDSITETEWIISPKYDGCHAIFCFDDGKHVATYSRTGEVVSSMPHIAASLMDLYPLATQPRVAICGEAWMVGSEFNVVSGAFRRHAPQPQLQFVPFDIVPWDYNDEGTSGPPVRLGESGGYAYPAPYKKRLESLITMRKQGIPSQVLIPRYYPVPGTLQEALLIAKQVAFEHKARVDSFFDGAVLAQASGKYTVGSGKGAEFIKVKPLLSYTAKVEAVVSDLGSKTGKNTCVLMFTLDGMVQKVSTGLTQEQADLWTKFPEAAIGLNIEVEAMGKTVNGYLREPRFKGIRTDI